MKRSEIEQELMKGGIILGGAIGFHLVFCTLGEQETVPVSKAQVDSLLRSKYLQPTYNRDYFWAFIASPKLWAGSMKPEPGRVGHK